MAASKSKNSKQAKYTRSGSKRTDFVLALAICALFLCLALFNQWTLKNDIELYFAFYASLIFLFTFFREGSLEALNHRITPIFIILSAHTLLFFVGLFYAWFPKFALQQFFLNIGGWFIFASVFILFMRDEKNIRRVIAPTAVCIAVVSFVSIELATSRYLISIFNSISGLISGTMPADYASFETNTRITSVMGNPNTFAPVAAIGMLLGVWLAGKHGSRRHSGALYMAVGILSGTAFVLSFSMGTILMLAPALLGLLFFARREDRKTLFFTMTYTMILSVIGAVFVYALMKRVIFAPLAALAVSAGAGYLYAFVRPVRIGTVKADKKTRTAVYSAGAIVLCAVGIAAFVLKGAYPLAPQEGFRRAVALKPGDYTIEFALSGPQDCAVSVAVSSMTTEQAALKEQTELAAATVRSGEPVTFAVPTGSKAVFFRVAAGSELTVTKAAVRKVMSEGFEKNLSLKYAIIPEFMVNRMQALWVNDNAIQRFIFFRDGVRVGMTSPIVGLGGGAYEGMIYNKSDYYYETVHTHNHYIQCFIDGGILGFILFAGLAVFAVLALFHAKKKEKNGDALPFLAASILLIFLHSLLEVDFSSPAFVALVSVLLGWTASQYGPGFAPSKKARGAVAVSAVAFTAISLLLAGGRILAVNAVHSNPTLDSLDNAVRLDPFNGDDYKISYLLSTMNNTDSAIVSSKAQLYLHSIEDRRISPDSAFLLSQYYFMRANPDYDRGVSLAEYYIHEKRVNPKVWDEIFGVYLKLIRGASDENLDKVAASIQNLSDDLKELNTSLPKEIKPRLTACVLDWAMQRSEASQSGDLIDSRLLFDLNGDGSSDLIESRTADQIRWSFGVDFSASGYYLLKTFMPEGGALQILVNGAEQGFDYDANEKCYISLIRGESVADVVIAAGPASDDLYFTVSSVS